MLTMEKQVIFAFLMCSIFTCFLLIVSISAEHPLFILGDSILDVGNNNYINTSTLAQANFYPYGITFFHHPTGRCSNGLLIGDFIAQHAKLPLIPPYLQPGAPQFDNGINFASIGAGALVQTYQGLVIDLHMQLSYYKKVESMFKYKFGDIKTREILGKAVYLFSIGSNDYESIFLTNSTFLRTYSKSEYVDMVIGNITHVIMEIYKTGGRRFAILNSPAVGCFPSERILSINGSCIKDLLSYIIQHNKALVHTLQHLKMQLPGFKYAIYDFYTNIQKRIDNPTTYGYKEGKTACCGSGKFRGVFNCGGKRPLGKEYELCQNVDDYVFWDAGHPTSKIYKEIADEMWNSHTYGSYSVKDLFLLP